MKNAIIYLLALVPATAGVAFGQQGRRQVGGPASTNERPSNNTPIAKPLVDPYRILLTTSIFARDRRSSTEQRVADPVDPPPNPETYLVNRGIVQEDGKFVGFIEDTRDNTTFRVHVGDSVGTTGGKIADMALDSENNFVLKYTRRDGLTTLAVPLGYNLAKQEIAPPAVAVADATSSFGGGQFGQGGFGGGRFGGGTNFGGQNDFAALQSAMQQRGRRGQGGFGGGFDPTTGGFGTAGGGGGRRQQGIGGGGGGQFDPTQQGGGQGGGRRGRRGGGGGGGGQFGG